MKTNYYKKINEDIVLVNETTVAPTLQEKEDSFMDDIFDFVGKFEQMKSEIIGHISEGNYNGATMVLKGYQNKLKNDDNDLETKKSYILINTVSLFLGLLKDTDITSPEHYLVSEIFATNDYIVTEHIILSYWLRGSFEHAITFLEQYPCHLKEKNYDDFFSIFSKDLQRKDYFDPKKDIFSFNGEIEKEHDKKMREVFLELVSAYNLSHNIADKVEILGFNSKVTKRKI